MPDFRKFAFTFTTVILIPVLFFVLLEISLRLLGVGTSFDYFHEIDINGQPHYQENPQFADQFYPPSLGIGPLENTFTKARGADLVRVYVLGGSAAMGFPHKNHGLDRLLAAQLKAALPSRKIEIINTSMTSVNSHVVYEVARSIPANSADFAVILMGNNEVVGPYGPGTFNQNFLSNLSLIRWLQALKRTRLWQALSGVILSASPSDARQELEWEGMQMFTDHGVPHDDPRMDSVYSHYEDNLRDIVGILQDKGLHVLLSSVPVNLRHSAPFLSLHRGNLSEDQRERWRELHESAISSFEAQEWGDAIVGFQSALAIDPDYADSHFRIATAYEQLGDFDTAKTHYLRALDLDALRFRADTQINQIIREVAAELDGEALDYVDSAAAFERASRPFQPGWNLLLEHVHYDFDGNHVLAAELSMAVMRHLGAPDGYRLLSGAEVARRIGFPNHETIDVIKNLQGMIEHPPFPGQSNYDQLQTFLDRKLARVTAEVGSPAEVVARRQDVVDAGVADWKLHFELAELQRYLRNERAMYRHLDQLVTLYPHNRESYTKLADLLSRQGRWSEVIPLLEQSMYYTRGDATKTAETIGWLGMAYFRTGEYDKATKLLQRMPEEYPDQIGLTLKAFGTLVKYSRDAGETEDMERHLREVQRYARSLVQSGQAEDYPPLYQRMAQIMSMAGYPAEAKAWARGRIP